MKDYYRILHVAPEASQKEIKRAYRKLVQQFHPDVNPDPRAQDLVREVNEAYEILGHSAKRMVYDRQRTNPFPVEEQFEYPKHRDPAYHRRPQPSPRPQGISQVEVMAKALPYMRPIIWVSFLLCVMVILDFSLPRTYQTETLVTLTTKNFRKGWQAYVFTETGRELNISGDDFLTLSVGEQLVFTESAILKVLVKIQAVEHKVEITNLATLYRNFIFLPILLLIASILGLFSVGTTEFRFNLSLATVFLLIFTMIILLK